jgi:hypothetical protein
MPATTRELLDIVRNHADSEEAVAVTLNTPQGKGKQVVDHGEGTSSRFKKLKKSDKRRRDENLVAVVERKVTRPKNSSAKADGQGRPTLRSFRKAPGCDVPPSRGPGEAHAQKLSFDQELRQQHPQAKGGGSTKKGSAISQQ